MIDPVTRGKIGSGRCGEMVKILGSRGFCAKLGK